MKISHKWLQEFVAFASTPTELSDALNMLGIEVESYVDQSLVYKNFVTARVISKEKHPKADKLSVCRVFDGLEERVVVCGAPNVDVGQMVVFAKPGAIVPNGGFEISSRVLRGVESNGMICSKSELNIEDDTAGIWILDASQEVGIPIASALGLDDVIYDISITPNRADALSHLGIARIVAAFEGKTLKSREVEVKEEGQPINLSIDIKDAVNCPRYLARIVRNVTVGPSPSWLKQRLEAVGLRPRNVIVDITNYVLMECGHPLHAFDYNAIGNDTIEVKTANTAEIFTTLDDKQRSLDSSTLMICDPNHYLAIAGVMGGSTSAINNETTSVLIESAYFLPRSIRRTARQLGISSDASYRFERGTDINVLQYAVDRAAELMIELAGGVVDKGTSEAYVLHQEKATVRLRYERVRSILGFDVSNGTIEEIVRKLDFKVLTLSEQFIDLVPPSYRVDVNEEIDIIEEIAIMSNYDSIPLVTDAAVSFGSSKQPSVFQEPKLKKRIRDYLCAQGFNEIVTQNQTDPGSEALIGSKGIELANPLGEELSIMRSSLIPASMRVLSHNLRQGAESIRLFDIAKTFHGGTEARSTGVDNILEREEICLTMSGIAERKGWTTSARDMDYFDIKGQIESLGEYIGTTFEFGTSQRQEFGVNQCAIIYKGKTIGTLAEVATHVTKHFECDQKVYMAQIDLTDIYCDVETRKTYSRVSNFPKVERDLAFVLASSTASETVHRIIVQHGSAILRVATLFDVFEHESLGPNNKSIAFRLVFSSPERTLTDEEVDKCTRDIIEAVTSKIGAALRS